MEATFMPGSSPSHYLQTALKGGFYLTEPVSPIPEEHFRFRTQKSAAWPSQHKYPTSRRLFLNATSGRQLYFDKETNAEETYLQAGLSRHWEHIISFTAERLVLCLLLQMYKEASADGLIFYLTTCSNTNAVGFLRYVGP
ncbi:hypothetical protein HID58_063694 [Brassica napus]|uniref:Uncharacterized protein n=1 Tax=Brassica napus TaxID=3708 RepID=A0ABQ7XHS5_BRANA|nr:hypothetical protein HID58_063694 [Brassica napus]